MERQGKSRTYFILTHRARFSMHCERRLSTTRHQPWRTCRDHALQLIHIHISSSFHYDSTHEICRRENKDNRK
ncbi:hypothetical protein PUN28_013713 [Cardiocondyla obscurior]|uniref:Uncharacterized protein n=1 Tax=Cardiocondyla obscurior TaxID=286306 RepID=A0AAW2F5W7_9HYME